MARSFDAPPLTPPQQPLARGGRVGRGRRASLHVSNFVTGHYETIGNNLGLRSLGHAGLRAHHWPLVTINDEPPAASTASPESGAPSSGAATPPQPPPDAIVSNSRLHDTLFMPERLWSPQAFTDATHRRFRLRCWRRTRPPTRDHSRQRDGLAVVAAIAVAVTVASAGTVNRRLPLNPQKVEVQNRLTTGALLAAAAAAEAAEGGVGAGACIPPARRFGFIDAFDVTFSLPGTTRRATVAITAQH